MSNNVREYYQLLTQVENQIDSIIYDMPFDLDAEKVFEVMSSSVKIEKNIKVINAI